LGCGRGTYLPFLPDKSRYVPIYNIKSLGNRLAAARAEQERLRSRVRLVPLPLPAIRFVGAADVTFLGEREMVAAALVVTNIATGDVVEEATAVQRIAFPYIPGYLSFREGPAIVAAWEKLSRKPDVLLFDGQGIAHPRRLGIASHIGVLLDVPSVGCAKKRLVGEPVEPGPRKGDWVPLVHDGDTVGAVLRTRLKVKPVFVSPGHRADLPSSIALVLRLCFRYRLLDPARRAHRITQEIRRGRP
jgi:deoxyribonuclease V